MKDYLATHPSFFFIVDEIMMLLGTQNNCEMKTKCEFIHGFNIYCQIESETIGDHKFNVGK